MIEYKGYLGVVAFDPEIDAFHGTVVNTHDVISFYGSSVTELREEMQKSVEEYLAFCREQGKKPEAPSPPSQTDRGRGDLDISIANILDSFSQLSEMEKRELASEIMRWTARRSLSSVTIELDNAK